jgi:hypothetical protein
MDFIDQLQSLGKLIEKQKSDITTKEATKKVFVLPFIRALGFEVSDSREVVADFSTDIDCDNNGSVDYAICRDSKPVMLFECKSCTIDLTGEDVDQLRSNFVTASAMFGVLTNGISYRFYSDIEKENIMDDKPFMELNLLDIDEKIIAELTGLSKKTFELDQIFSVASELRYIQAIKNVLFEQSSSPSLEFVRLFANQVYPGKKTEQVLDQFAPVVKEAFKQFITDCLQSVMNDRVEEPVADNDAANSVCLGGSGNDQVVTDEEFEGFFVVNIT